MTTSKNRGIGPSIGVRFPVAISQEEVNKIRSRVGKIAEDLSLGKTISDVTLALEGGQVYCGLMPGELRLIPLIFEHLKALITWYEEGVELPSLSQIPFEDRIIMATELRFFADALLNATIRASNERVWKGNGFTIPEHPSANPIFKNISTEKPTVPPDPFSFERFFYVGNNGRPIERVAFYDRTNTKGEAKTYLRTVYGQSAKEFAQAREWEVISPPNSFCFIEVSRMRALKRPILDSLLQRSDIDTIAVLEIDNLSKHPATYMALIEKARQVADKNLIIMQTGLDISFDEKMGVIGSSHTMLTGEIVDPISNYVLRIIARK